MNRPSTKIWHRPIFVLIHFALFINSVILAWTVSNNTSAAVAELRSDRIVVEKFSSVIRKSFSNVGCNTQSYNCRSCNSFARCRFCIMRPVGGARLLIEMGGEPIDTFIFKSSSLYTLLKNHRRIKYLWHRLCSEWTATTCGTVC